MSFLQQFRAISTFAFDVDGVLTDGTLYVFDSGEKVRRMNIKDGYALQLAIKKGYRIVVISGAVSKGVQLRLAQLGITDTFFGVSDKRAFLDDWLKKAGLDWKEVLFMGDDVPDAEAMQASALSCCPADAVSAIRHRAKYISPFKGGEGCVRDVVEKVLKLKGDWQDDTSIASK